MVSIEPVRHVVSIRDVDAEAILAVPKVITGNKRLQIKDLPCAAVIHHGPHTPLNQSYGVSHNG